MPTSTRLPFAALALGLTLPLAALAQTRTQEENYALLGAGVRSRPAYDGSASQTTEAIPLVRYYGRPWFARTTQGILEGGARMEIAPGLAFGGQLAYEQGRKASEAAFLRDHNVPDVDVGASLGVHLEWDGKLGPAPVNVLLRTRQHTDSDKGMQVDLRSTAGVFESGRFTAGVFAQATWANAKSTNTFYGITPQQSAATGLPPFEAGSGLLSVGFGVLGGIDLGREWVVLWSLEVRRLQGDAADSPLAERTSNNYASIGLAYRF
jgi:MipA family protein